MSTETMIGDPGSSGIKPERGDGAVIGGGSGGERPGFIEDGIHYPRDLMSPTELDISTALEAVESLDVNPKSIEAINLLTKAGECIADYVDAYMSENPCPFDEPEGDET